MSTQRTPPNQHHIPSRSESDISKLFTKDDQSTNVNITNITQRTKRRCPSVEENINDNLADFKNEIRDMIQTMVCLQSSRLDKLENHILEIKNSNSNIEVTNSEIEKSMSSLSDQLTSLETKIINLEKERNSMAIKLTTLEEKVESYERSLVKTCVELRNVPKRSNESKKMLYDTLLELSKHLVVNIQVSDIRDVLRQPSKKENQNSTLTVEFTNTLVKSNFLSAVKEHNKRNPNNKLNSTHLGIAAPKTPTYVAEQLTTNSKRLFYLARNYSKVNQYAFCWTADGRILMKKTPDSPSIVIRSELQLKNLSVPHIV